jgi:hypothetical protein
MPVERFEPGQRIVVTNVERMVARGPDVARWLDGRPGVVTSLAKSGGGAWIRVDDTLPPALRGRYPPEHVLGRSLLLFPWECQPAHDRGYAPFHRDEFASTLDAACARFDHAYLLPPADPTRPEHAWWRDVTQERRELSSKGLGEHVYRFGVEQRKVTLLIYSSVSASTGWSRPASEDAIRFVHEVRRGEPMYLDTGTRVNRTGMTPLERVGERILELLHPGFVRELARRSWTRDAWSRGR